MTLLFKHKPKDKKQEPELAKSNSGHYKLNEVLYTRERLHGPAKLVSDNELQQLIDMRQSVDNIDKLFKHRFMICVLMVLFAFILGLLDQSHVLGFVAVGIVIAGLSWFSAMRSTNSKYQSYLIDRQISWASFLRMAAAYLPEVTDGANMYSVLNKITPRMDNEEDRANLERLTVRMSADPTDSEPFLDFAHKYSASKEAETVMLVIQSMYNGNVDARNIETLANNATKELQEQINVVIDHKLSKFKQTGTKVVVAFMIPTFAYVSFFAGNMIMSLFKSIKF